MDPISNVSAPSSHHTAISGEHSPSPSPALSAYSYSTSSTESDFDLNALALDNWGRGEEAGQPAFPSRTNARAAPSSQVSEAAENTLSGTATPTAGSCSSSGLENLSSCSSNIPNFSSIQTEVEEDLDEEDDEPSGFDVEDENEEDMHANGVPAARGLRLDARKANTHAFKQQVLHLFNHSLQLNSWCDDTANPKLLPLSAEKIELKRISGAFSNAVFFVSYDAKGEKPNTVLLRVYGSGTEVLLSRRAELLILHTLSSLYEIGPHILGTFANGRVETFFDADPIGKEGVRDLGTRREYIKEDGSLLVRGTEGRAQWVARRMRQLHEVPLETMKKVLEQGDLRSSSDGSTIFGRGIENHLFARSHKPHSRRPPSMPAPHLDQSRPLRDSPAPLAEENADTSLFTLGTQAVREEPAPLYGYEPQRNSSVASFDSLATSYNSIDGGSTTSISTDNLTSPSLEPVASSMSASHLSDQRAKTQSARYGSQSPSASRNASYRMSSFPTRASTRTHQQPYPGMWRRSKRWAREAGKVFALVDEFAQLPQGRRACQDALKGTKLEGLDFSPFSSTSFPYVTSEALGSTINSLQSMLLGIASIDFPHLLKEMDAYKKFVRKWERKNGFSRRVLAHGDTQYSNLLLIKDSSVEDENAGKGMPRGRRDQSPLQERRSVDTISKEVKPKVSPTLSKKSFPRMRKAAPYERLVVIDFEYCSPNPRAYDIANAFHEWRFDYHHETNSWSPFNMPYPTKDERRRWLRAYVEQGRLLRMRGKAPKSSTDSPGMHSSSPNFATSMSGGHPPDELELPPSMVTTDEAPTPTKASRPALPLTSRPSSHSKSPKSQASISPILSGRSSLAYLEASIEREIERLEREIDIFSPACHASWALWGVTFARETIENLLVQALEQGTRDSSSTEKTTQVAAGSAESFDNVSSLYSSPGRHAHAHC